MILMRFIIPTYLNTRSKKLFGKVNIGSILNYMNKLKTLRLYYKMFKIGKNEKKKRIERFNELEDDKTLRQCYKNKIEIGCTYPQDVEDELKELDAIIQKEDKTPWWVYIID